MGAWVGKWEPGLPGAHIWARASSAHRTVLALYLGVIDFDSSAFVGHPPFSALCLHSSHVRDKALGSEADTVCVSWWQLSKEGASFGSSVSPSLHLCFTHLLDFPETVIKIHPSDGSSLVLATESPLVARHLCKKLLQPDQNIWEKENHLVLTSSPCSQWADYRAFSWQKEKESLFFARIIEVHEDFPQISEIHKGTPRDRGNDPHSHLPRGWFIFCFMCDGH